MSVEYWIMLYLFVNGALCYIGGSDDWDDPFTPENVSKALVGAAFAIPIAIVVLSYHGLVALAKWLDGLVQFRTYWHYVFNRNKLMNKDHDLLLVLHRNRLTRRNSNSIKDRIYRHAEGLVHRLNNFTPEP